MMKGLDAREVGERFEAALRDPMGLKNLLGRKLVMVVGDTGVRPEIAPAQLRAKAAYIPWTDKSAWKGEPIKEWHGTVVKCLACEAFNAPTLREDVEVISFQCLDRSGSGDAESIAAAITCARRNGGDGLNMSLGAHFETPGEEKALRRQFREVERQGNAAYLEDGILIATAAGNEDERDDWQTDDVDVPALYPWSMAIGGTDPEGVKSYFAGDGATLEGVARAERIYGLPGMAGTSFATPLTFALAMFLKCYVFGAVPAYELRGIMRLLAVHGNCPEVPWCRDHGFGSWTPAIAKMLAAVKVRREAEGYVDALDPL